MPTVRDPRAAERPVRETWPRWLGVNLYLLACVLVAVGAGLVAISALAGANDGDDPPWTAYAWMCLLCGAILRLPPLRRPASGATSR